MFERLAGWQQAIVFGLLISAVRFVTFLANGGTWDTRGAVGEALLYISGTLVIWAVGRLWKEVTTRA